MGGADRLQYVAQEELLHLCCCCCCCYYELDEEVVNTYLCAEWYDGDDDSSWVRLEPVEDAGAAGPSGSASGAANAEA